MPVRKPQINFQVDPPLKTLYEEARLAGHWVTRFCAAGLLLMVEDPRIRARALDRLVDWEAEYAKASPKQIRAFVRGARDAMQAAPRDSRPTRRARPARKGARRGKGE